MLWKYSWLLVVLALCVTKVSIENVTSMNTGEGNIVLLALFVTNVSV